MLCRDSEKCDTRVGEGDGGAEENKNPTRRMWGTNKQVLLLKGRVKKDEEGTLLKYPSLKGSFEVFNLNQTTLKEEKLNDIRDSIHPFTIKQTHWEIMD